MTDEELIKEAELRYPDGTKYIGIGRTPKTMDLASNGSSGREVTKDGSFQVQHHWATPAVYNFSKNAYVYYNGEWAEQIGEKYPIF